MKNSREIVVGMFAAAAAGVIIGMLLAPEKGEDLRRSIKNGVGDWSKKLKDLLAEGSELIEEGKETLSNALEVGEDEIADLGKDQTRKRNS